MVPPHPPHPGPSGIPGRWPPAIAGAAAALRARCRLTGPKLKAMAACTAILCASVRSWAARAGFKSFRTGAFDKVVRPNWVSGFRTTGRASRVETGGLQALARRSGPRNPAPPTS